MPERLPEHPPLVEKLPLIELREELIVPVTSTVVPSVEDPVMEILLPMTVPDSSTDEEHEGDTVRFPATKLSVSKPTRSSVRAFVFPLKDTVPCQVPERLMVALEASAMGLSIGTSPCMPHEVVTGFEGVDEGITYQNPVEGRQTA